MATIDVYKDLIPIYINDLGGNAGLCVTTELDSFTKPLYTGCILARLNIDVEYELNNKFRKELKQMLKIVQKYTFKNKMGTDMPQLNNIFTNIIKNYLHQEIKIKQKSNYNINKLNKKLFNISRTHISKNYINNYSINDYKFKEFDDYFYTDEHDKNIHKIINEIYMEQERC